MRTQIAISVLLTLFLVGCGGGTSSAPPPIAPSNQILSLGVDTPYSSLPLTQQSVTAALTLATGAGAKAIVAPYQWSDLEPSPGAIDVSSMQQDLAFYRSAGLQIYLGIQVINTVKRQVPPDLETTSFDDPKFIQRFHALLDAIRAVLPTGVLYISIGNEVDVYLENTSQWATYQAFYEDAVSYLHQTLPGVPIGVTSTYGGLMSITTQVVALNTKSDALMLTYYPLQGDNQVKPANSTVTDFPNMIALAGTKPVVLQEVGYPSGALNGSSEQIQAQFVTDAFSAWRAAGDHMPFFSYYVLYDFDATTCATLDAYYGSTDPAFTSYLCTIGLRHDDGTVKPAWSAFVAAAQQ